MVIIIVKKFMVLRVYLSKERQKSDDIVVIDNFEIIDQPNKLIGHPVNFNLFFCYQNNHSVIQKQEQQHITLIRHTPTTNRSNINQQPNRKPLEAQKHGEGGLSSNRINNANLGKDDQGCDSDDNDLVDLIYLSQKLQQQPPPSSSKQCGIQTRMLPIYTTIVAEQTNENERDYTMVSENEQSSSLFPFEGIYKGMIEFNKKKGVIPFPFSFSLPTSNKLRGNDTNVFDKKDGVLSPETKTSIPQIPQQNSKLIASSCTPPSTNCNNSSLAVTIQQQSNEPNKSNQFQQEKKPLLQNKNAPLFKGLSALQKQQQFLNDNNHNN